MASHILDEASGWFIAMREPRVGADLRERFAEWLRASPVHVRAYLEIASVWTDAAHIGADVPAEAAAASHESANAENVVPLTPFHARVAAPHGAQAGRRVRSWLAAAVLALFVAGGAFAWWLSERAPTYEARVGEQRVLVLEDGSVVRLNARSRIRIEMSEHLRHLDLLEGQVLVYVSKDSARPFVVQDGPVAIKAVGTAFDVNQRSSGTVVTVVEGHVLVDGTADRGRRLAQSPAKATKLRSAQNEEASSVALVAGEQVMISPKGVVGHKSNADVAAATGWLEHTLTFQGETLSTVVEELNRYSKTPIVIADASLGEMRINAVLRSSSPESFLRFARRIDGVEVTESDIEIRISRRSHR